MVVAFVFYDSNDNYKEYGLYQLFLTILGAYKNKKISTGLKFQTQNTSGELKSFCGDLKKSLFSLVSIGQPCLRIGPKI